MRSWVTGWKRTEDRLQGMATEAEVGGLHPEQTAEGVPVRVVAGEAGDPAVGEGQSRDLHGRNDIDAVFDRGLPVAMAVKTEGRKLLLEPAYPGGPAGKMAQAAVLLDLGKRIADFRPLRRRRGRSCDDGRHDADATCYNDSICTKVHAAPFELSIPDLLISRVMSLPYHRDPLLSRQRALFRCYFKAFSCTIF